MALAKQQPLAPRQGKGAPATATIKTFRFPRVDSGTPAFADGGSEPLVATVHVYELLRPDCGLYVWPSAEVLARHLAATASTTCKGRTVVELGAGTGLAGLTCVLCGARTVYLTDHASKRRVLQNLRSAVELNGVNKAGEPTLVAVRTCWSPACGWALPLL
jgi:hypothetical protein